MRRVRFVSILLLAGWLGLALGCRHGSSPTIGSPGGYESHAHAHGPPPHAPAHGHRWKHHHDRRDVELVFDSGLGVYVVVGVPDHYWWDGFYLRIREGRWLASAHFDAGWKPYHDRSLPPGLRKKHAKHRRHQTKHRHHHDRGRGAAKGRWW